MAEFDRDNPLFERNSVPFEVLTADATNNEASETRTNVFTVRILQGHRPFRNGNGRERVFRFEMSDECNLVKATPDFDRSQGCSTPQNNGRSRGMHLQRTPKLPIIHAPFMTADRGKEPMWTQHRGHCNEHGHDNTFQYNLPKKPTAITNRSIELYELEVGESDFAELRRDQALLVDFNDFANSLISLIQFCWFGDDEVGTGMSNSQNDAAAYTRQSSSSVQFGSGDFGWNGHNNQSEAEWRNCHWNQQHMMRSPSPYVKQPVSTYSCRLQTELSAVSDGNQWKKLGNGSSAHARFSVVESNQFRELTHLALTLNVGTDKSIRSYLSSRLSQVMTEKASIDSQLSAMQQRCEAAERSVIEANKRLAETTQAYESEKYQLQVQAGERLQSENNRHLAQIKEVNASKDSELRSLNEELQQCRLNLESKIRLLEESNKKINEDKASCQHENERLSTRLSQQDTANKLLTNEMTSLRNQLERISREKAVTETSLRELQSLLASLEHSNSDHKHTISQSEAQIASTEKVYADAKQTISRQHNQIDDLRRRLVDAESEAAKYKELASRYQTNRIEMKKRMKEKVETIRMQEEAIQTKDKEAIELKHRVQRLADDLSRVQGEKDGALKDLTNATKKMEDDSKKLDNNQQV
jgi:spindle assembly abnormal protein 6